MMHAYQRRTIEILLVDDNPGDLQLIKEMLAEAKHSNRAHAVRGGRAALMFLRKQGAYRDVPTPDLVLLDINMPGMNGLEVIQEIRTDPELTCLPIIVLTSSDDERDIRRCYELRANCYVSKPGGLDGLGRIVRSIDEFWLSTARLPYCGPAALRSTD